MKTIFIILISLLPTISLGGALVPSLGGSPEAIVFENIVADAAKLRRVRNDSELNALVNGGRFVRLPKGGNIQWHKDLKTKYAYVLPHVRNFLLKTAKKGHVLVVSSAVRPKAYQRNLRKRNGNAGSSEGPRASSHSTGSTVDLSYKSLTKEQARKLARYLLERERHGEVQITMERFQPCFHVMVLPRKK